MAKVHERQLIEEPKNHICTNQKIIETMCLIVDSECQLWKKLAAKVKQEIRMIDRLQAKTIKMA